MSTVRTRLHHYVVSSKRDILVHCSQWGTSLQALCGDYLYGGQRRRGDGLVVTCIPCMGARWHRQIS